VTKGVADPRAPYAMSVHGEQANAAAAEFPRTSARLGMNGRDFEQPIAEVFGKTLGAMVNPGSCVLRVAAENDLLVHGLPWSEE